MSQSWSVARGPSPYPPALLCQIPFLLLVRFLLICWSVEAVLNSGEFDDVYVSTDSDKIFDAVKHLNVKRHIRPAHHATTRATVLDAMMDLMENIPKYDIFAFFLPTCPFIKSESIKQGVQMLDDVTDSVVSVSYYEEPIQLACIKKGEHIIPIFDNLTAGLTNSKFIQKYVKPNGKINDLVSLLNEQDLFPCIFFSYSRKKCEEYANMISTSLVDHEEVHHIEFILNKYLKGMFKNYDKLMNSKNADVQNINYAGGAGSITAAQFLGHSVLVPGQVVSPDDKGEIHGVVDLPAYSNDVGVTFTNPSGEIIHSLTLGSQEKGLVGFSWTDIPDEIKKNKTRLTIQAYAGNGEASDGISTAVYNKVIAASAPKNSEDVILETKDYGEISANDAIKLKTND